jgi:hypothetical protein
LAWVCSLVERLYIFLDHNTRIMFSQERHAQLLRRLGEALIQTEDHAYLRRLTGKSQLQLVPDELTRSLFYEQEEVARDLKPFYSIYDYIHTVRLFLRECRSLHNTLTHAQVKSDSANPFNRRELVALAQSLLPRPDFQNWNGTDALPVGGVVPAGGIGNTALAAGGVAATGTGIVAYILRPGDGDDDVGDGGDDDGGDDGDDGDDGDGGDGGDDGDRADDGGDDVDEANIEEEEVEEPVNPRVVDTGSQVNTTGAELGEEQQIGIQAPQPQIDTSATTQILEFTKLALITSLLGSNIAGGFVDTGLIGGSGGTALALPGGSSAVSTNVTQPGMNATTPFIDTTLPVDSNSSAAEEILPSFREWQEDVYAGQDLFTSSVGEEETRRTAESDDGDDLIGGSGGTALVPSESSAVDMNVTQPGMIATTPIRGESTSTVTPVKEDDEVSENDTLTTQRPTTLETATSAVKRGLSNVGKGFQSAAEQSKQAIETATSVAAEAVGFGTESGVRVLRELGRRGAEASRVMTRLRGNAALYGVRSLNPVVNMIGAWARDFEELLINRSEQIIEAVKDYDYASMAKEVQNNAEDIVKNVLVSMRDTTKNAADAVDDLNQRFGPRALMQKVGTTIAETIVELSESASMRDAIIEIKLTRYALRAVLRNSDPDALHKFRDGLRKGNTSDVETFTRVQKEVVRNLNHFYRLGVEIERGGNNPPSMNATIRRGAYEQMQRSLQNATELSNLTSNSTSPNQLTQTLERMKMNANPSTQKVYNAALNIQREGTNLTSNDIKYLNNLEAQEASKNALAVHDLLSYTEDISRDLVMQGKGKPKEVSQITDLEAPITVGDGMLYLMSFVEPVTKRATTSLIVNSIGSVLLKAQDKGLEMGHMHKLAVVAGSHLTAQVVSAGVEELAILFKEIFTIGWGQMTTMRDLLKTAQTRSQTLGILRMERASILNTLAELLNSENYENALKLLEENKEALGKEYEELKKGIQKAVSSNNHSEHRRSIVSEIQVIRDKDAADGAQFMNIYERTTNALWGITYYLPSWEDMTRPVRVPIPDLSSSAVFPNPATPPTVDAKDFLLGGGMSEEEFNRIDYLNVDMNGSKHYVEVYVRDAPIIADLLRLNDLEDIEQVVKLWSDLAQKYANDPEYISTQNDNTIVKFRVLNEIDREAIAAQMDVILGEIREQQEGSEMTASAQIIEEKRLLRHKLFATFVALEQGLFKIFVTKGKILGGTTDDHALKPHRWVNHMLSNVPQNDQFGTLRGEWDKEEGGAILMDERSLPGLWSEMANVNDHPMRWCPHFGRAFQATLATDLRILMRRLQHLGYSLFKQYEPQAREVGAGALPADIAYEGADCAAAGLASDFRPGKGKLYDPLQNTCYAPVRVRPPTQK